LADLALELVVESLLQAFAPFGVWPEKFVILNDAVRDPPGAAGIADDVAGQGIIGIGALIDGQEHERVRTRSIEAFRLRLLQILRDHQRHDSPVLVMLEDEFLGKRDHAARDAAGDEDLLLSEGQHFRF
jgi:hypothetical protein